jgi:hypothetical protein
MVHEKMNLLNCHGALEHLEWHASLKSVLQIRCQHHSRISAWFPNAFTVVVFGYDTLHRCRQL